ncbi:MAG: hypothetical protein IPO26_17185 [Saprospiraceae bacterium]|nr:hypothetical protein [Saprospiraceae bacterium]
MTDNPTNIPPKFQKYNRWLKYGVLSIVGLIALIFIWISNTDLPSFEDLENPKYDLASVIYDAKGTPFGRYYIEDRVAISYEQLSENVKMHSLSQKMTVSIVIVELMFGL